MKRSHVLGGLAGALGAVACPAALRAAAPVRVVTTALDASAEPFYAADMGFFRDAGVDVLVNSTSNGAVVSTAVAGNAADIGFANLMSVAVAFKRGIPFTVIAPGSYYDSRVPTSLLVVPKGSPITQARELNGKTIAAAGLRTITEFAPRVWMDKHGGDSSTVRFVEMNNPQILDALLTGRIDAAVLAEPFLEASKPVARTLAPAYDAIAPRFLVGVFFAHLDWAKSNPNVVARFEQAIVRTAAWANTHHRQSGDILVKFSKLNPAVVQKMLRIGYETKLDPAEMQPMIDVLARYGGIPQAFPADQIIFKP